MSDTATSERTATGPAAAGLTTGRSLALLKPLLLAVAFVVLLLVPIYVEEFWLRTGFAVFGAAIGAMGLNLLVGTTGQLSLAHAFFLAIGAVTYTFVAGEPGGVATEVGGLGLPPLLGMVLGVLLAGLAGLLFSPVAARLRGIYLGVASLGLVFIGIHLINTWEYVTGGFNGRIAPDFSLFGFEFSNNASYLAIAGVPFREAERLWYLGLFLAVPCLGCFGILRTIVDRLTVRGALVAEELLLMVKPAEAKPAAGGARPGAAPQPVAPRKPVPPPPAPVG